MADYSSELGREGGVEGRGLLLLKVALEGNGVTDGKSCIRRSFFSDACNQGPVSEVA